MSVLKTALQWIGMYFFGVAMLLAVCFIADKIKSRRSKDDETK